ncbi:MAG: sulfotransferase [Candidatus Dormibacteria bacterium]
MTGHPDANGASESVAGSRGHCPPQPSTCPSRDPGRFQPLLILAPARSCTSVVAAMLGQHPDLYSFPELTLFNGSTVADILDQDRLPFRSKSAVSVKRYHISGLLRAIAQVEIGGQTEADASAARRWLEVRRNWSGVHVFDVLLSRVQPRTGIDKSPDTAMSDDNLSRVVAGFPRARFLHLTRHPVTTIRSLQRYWFAHWPGSRQELLVAATSSWCAVHERALALARLLQPSRCLRAQAEVILSREAPGLERVVGWLGLERGSEALGAMRHPENSPYSGFGPANARGGNDPLYLRDPRPRIQAPGRLEEISTWGLDDALARRVLETAEALGYST